MLTKGHILLATDGKDKIKQSEVNYDSFCDVDTILPVPFHEAVCCRITTVTQPHPTLPTETSGFSTNLGGSMECALSPLVSVSVLLVLLKVAIW